MKTSSPLRYPGGKSALSGLLSQVRKLNNLGHQAIAEPFAGGAGASLTLLFSEETPEIFINDVDRSIYDFWWSVLHRPNMFTHMISRKRVTMAEWRRQRNTYQSEQHTN